MDHEQPGGVPDRFFTCLAKAGLPTALRDCFDEDAEDNLEAHVSASAPSTMVGFSTDVRRWCAHCAAIGVDPLNPHARNVRDFIRIFEDGRKPATIKRMVCNIGVLVADIAGNRKVTQTKLVKSEMKRVRREKGAGHKQAFPIRQRGTVTSLKEPAKPFSIEQMIQALATVKTLRSLRGQFILSLGGDTGRRHSEYVEADFQHLFPVEDGSGTGLFHVERSKTDQDGNGIYRFASARTMKLRRRWRKARIAAGEDVQPGSPLIIEINLHGQPRKRITTHGFQIALRGAVEMALNILSAEHPELADAVPEILRIISGHSFRVGWVQDLSLAKAPIDAICREGGWQTPAMVLLYGRNINAQFGATAQMLTDVGANDQSDDDDDNG